VGEVRGRGGEGSGRGIELACPPSEGCKEPLAHLGRKSVISMIRLTLF
jgi:hypothetical protein